MLRVPLPNDFRTVSCLGATTLASLALVLTSGCGSTESERIEHSPPPYTGEPLDCTDYPSSAAGDLEGHALRGEAQSLQASNGPVWYLHGTIDDFHVSAWSVPPGDQRTGRAHLTSTTSGEQLCVAKAEWTSELVELDSAPSISFYGFSSLGSCKDVQGTPSQLHYCEGCSSTQAHVWGNVGDSFVDVSGEWAGASSSSPGPAESLDAYFSGGGRLTFDTQADGSKAGFIRMEVNGMMKVYCVQDVIDEAPNDDDKMELTLDVIELGSCPGTELTGSVSACIL